MPIRKGPLLIDQYILLQHPDGLIPRLRPRNFFCGRSVAQRLAAVQAFYDQVRKRLRIAGVKKFSFQLGKLTPKVSGFPNYAVLRGGRVALTRAGSAPSSGC